MPDVPRIDVFGDGRRDRAMELVAYLRDADQEPWGELFWSTVTAFAWLQGKHIGPRRLRGPPATLLRAAAIKGH